MVNSDDPATKIANIPPFGLRMQSGLKRRLEGAAKASGRSLNSEIVARLERSFQEEGRPAQDLDKLDKRLEWLEDIWVNLMFEPRLDALANRLAALEERVGNQST